MITHIIVSVTKSIIELVSDYWLVLSTIIDCCCGVAVAVALPATERKAMKGPAGRAKLCKTDSRSQTSRRLQRGCPSWIIVRDDGHSYEQMNN